jgi:hypothetical protein
LAQKSELQQWREQGIERTLAIFSVSSAVMNQRFS